MKLTERIQKSYHEGDDFFETILSARELGLNPAEFYESSLLRNWEKRYNQDGDPTLVKIVGFAFANVKLLFTDPIGLYHVKNYIDYIVSNHPDNSK